MKEFYLFADMLVFKRFTATSAPKAKLEEYFTFHTTNAALKPWIYRPKNANYLLTMDLKDPKTNRPLQPRKPVAALSRKVLNDYIETVNPKSNELVEWFKSWTEVTPRKRALFNYISSQHIQNMLISSFFKLGYYDELLMNLHNNKAKFLRAQNTEAFDLEHVFNTIVMCKLHKNSLRNYRDGDLAKKKLMRTWSSITNRNNDSGLANCLINALAKQQGFEVQLKGLEGKEVSLPELANIENLNIPKLLSFIQDNQSSYLLARTIAQFGEDSSMDPKIKLFISSYQQVAQKLGKTDIYDSYLESMKNIWPNEAN